jgi:uncharacterized membrane protein YdjX (TVP38/TMEM64 family)
VDSLIAWISTHATSVWALPTTLVAYIVGGLLLVPVTLLILTTGIVFGPVKGLAFALAGAFTGAAVYYWLGRWLGRDVVQRFAGPRVRAATRAVARRGLLAVATVRLVPIAPHVVVGLAAGAARISFRDYMLGTIVAMLPGAAILVLLGGQLGTSLRTPTWEAVGIAAAILCGGLLIAWALQRWAGEGARLHEEADASRAGVDELERLDVDGAHHGKVIAGDAGERSPVRTHVEQSDARADPHPVEGEQREAGGVRSHAATRTEDRT